MKKGAAWQQRIGKLSFEQTESRIPRRFQLYGHPCSARLFKLGSKIEPITSIVLDLRIFSTTSLLKDSVLVYSWNQLSIGTRFRVPRKHSLRALAIIASSTFPPSCVSSRLASSDVPSPLVWLKLQKPPGTNRRFCSYFHIPRQFPFWAQCL